MEIYHSTPKNWASKKRAQRFSDPKEKRKSHPNGQPLRKVIYDEYTEFSFDKTVRDPSQNTRDKLQCPTPFERELNVQMVNTRNYSLNKRRNWEKVDEIMHTVQADERCVILPGKGRRNESETIKLGYFDMDEMKDEMDRQLREQRKYDISLDYNVNDLDNYIRDRFYDTIVLTGMFPISPVRT